MSKKYLKRIVNKLVNLGERQLAAEIKARLLIESELKKSKVPYRTEKFVTYIPKTQFVKLTTDGKKVEALATCFVSGKITNNYNLISSLTSSQPFIYQPNINFNPACSTISRSNHYFAPAIAVKAADVSRIIGAKMFEGEVKVQKVKHQSANILVGNKINPRHIIFSHYDSIGPGAVDNASGVALSLNLISNHPQLLKNTLFVIAGNEELSYDETIYWGHGYRVFEKKFSKIMKKTKQLIILDCLGHAKTKIIRNEETLMLGFPIKTIDKLLPKTLMLSGSISELMEIYHSDLDTPEKIDYELLEKVSKTVLQLIR